jgi:hypothetical protein
MSSDDDNDTPDQQTRVDGEGDREHSVGTTDSPASEAETPFVWNETGDSPPSDAETTHSETDAGTRHRLPPERYLLAGETIVERYDVDAGWVAVTTHRLLVFDPDSRGRRFETVDRPNVVGVGTTGGGSRTGRRYAWRAGGYAIVLLGGGLLVRAAGLQSLFAAPETGAPGVDGVLSVLSLVGALVGLLVTLLFVAGGLAAVIALGLGAWYLRSREPTLVVERAGDDDIALRLPPTVDGERLVAGIGSALADELEIETERGRAVGRWRA